MLRHLVSANLNPKSSLKQQRCFCPKAVTSPQHDGPNWRFSLSDHLIRKHDGNDDSDGYKVIWQVVLLRG
jgi:hypothetical protein